MYRPRRASRGTGHQRGGSQRRRLSQVSGRTVDGRSGRMPRTTPSGREGSPRRMADGSRGKSPPWCQTPRPLIRLRPPIRLGREDAGRSGRPWDSWPRVRFRGSIFRTTMLGHAGALSTPHHRPSELVEQTTGGYTYGGESLAFGGAEARAGNIFEARETSTWHAATTMLDVVWCRRSAA